MVSTRWAWIAVAALCATACGESANNVGGGAADVAGAQQDTGGTEPGDTTTVVDTTQAHDGGAQPGDVGTQNEPDANGTDAAQQPDTTVAQGPACSATNPNGAAFDGTAKGSEPWQKVGDFTVPTVDGDVSLSKLWTGCDSYVFVIYHPNKQYAAYAGAVWKTSPSVLFKEAPKNTHWFFMSYGSDAKGDASAQRDTYLDALLKLPAAQQKHWKPRLHFVTQRAFDLPGWIGASLKKKSVFFFTIDRHQRRREVGLVKPPVGNQPANLGYLAVESRIYNWEWQTDQDLAALPSPTVVDIFDKTPVQSGWGGKKHFVDVTLPAKDKMATLDTASLEIVHGCKDGIDKNCPDWDRETSLFLCARPKSEGPPPPVACKAKEKKPCPCIGADGKGAEGTQTCKNDGSGFGACSCGCAEIARQISTYKRHGRWLTDISPLLPLLRHGGKQRFAYLTVDKWIVTARLRLYNSGKPTKPTSIQYLWNGGQYHDKYNDNHKPKKVKVPAGMKKARIVALISGHGSGTDTKNCAEFCAHSHHFSVGGKEVVKQHPLVANGCLKKVPQGVVPNQFGTWPFARAGWCPGWDVKLWTADITAGLQPGKEAEISYKSLLGGKNYVPQWTGKGDYKPVIKMRSWIVFEQ